MYEQLDKSLTARLYQAGLSRDKALEQGADGAEFDQLEARFKGASIPVHILRGFKESKPYSCAYHTGGAAGASLRAMCSALG